MQRVVLAATVRKLGGELDFLRVLEPPDRVRGQKGIGRGNGNTELQENVRNTL